MTIGPDTVVVLTGAAHGIGAALVSELNRRNAVLALLDVDADGLENIRSGLQHCSTHVCDVSDVDAVEAAARTITTQHARVDLLINCAGVSVAGAVEALPLDDFQRAMAVNFWGIVHTCRAFLPHLRASAKQHRAGICNVLSDFALTSLPTKSAYAASKHAARALTDSLNAELEGSGVFVCAVYPGATATDLVRRGRAVDPAKRDLEADFLGRGMGADVVARRIVRGIERERARVLIGRDTRLIDAAVRLSPGLVQAAVRRYWRRVPFL